jgi:beta-galactosidase
MAGDTARGVVTVTNCHDFVDLSGLAFYWSYEEAPHAKARSAHETGQLAVPPLGPGESTEVELPAPRRTDRSGAREAWWTVRALLAEDTAWAPAGHEVAWTQFAAAEAELADATAPGVDEGAIESAEPGRWTAPRGVAHTPRLAEGGMIVLGAGTFDAADGRLRLLNCNLVQGPVLDVWRAPIDNDRGMNRFPDGQLERRWREAGLHRMQHRVERVTVGEDTLTVVTRVAPASSGLALRTVYSWTAVGESLRLELQVEPEGDWQLPLPRLGMRLGLCPTLDTVEWYGGGPGEAYPDSRAASRIGSYRSTVDALQTRYVRPQENGARADVRWAELRRTDGTGIRLAGAPPFWLTVRPWSTRALDEAEHTHELRRDPEVLWVHLDHGLHGLGSHACGPEVLPAFRLTAAPAAFSVTLSALGVRDRGADREATEQLLRAPDRDAMADRDGSDASPKSHGSDDLGDPFDLSGPGLRGRGSLGG